MTSQSTTLKNRAFLVARRKLGLVATSRRHATSAMMRQEEPTPDSQSAVTFPRRALDLQAENSAVDIFRVGKNHPLQEDFFQGTEMASTLLVSWKVPSDVDGPGDRLAHSGVLDALKTIWENADIQVTPAFRVLDGKGDKLGTVCMETNRSKGRVRVNKDALSRLQDYIAFKP